MSLSTRTSPRQPTASGPGDPLELEVSNLGPIVEARIDLRPLTVFVGPSNTGKSYLAILIYALHRLFSSYGGDLGPRRMRRGDRMLWSHGPPEPNRPTMDALSQWAREMLLEQGDGRPEGGLVLPGSLTSHIGSVFDAHGPQLGREIGRCFGIDENRSLIRQGNRNGARIVFRRQIPDNSAPPEHELTIRSQSTELRTPIPEGLLMKIDVSPEDRRMDRLRRMVEEMLSPSRGEGSALFARMAREALIELAMPQMAGPLCRPAFYLPADRTGVMHSHQVVVSALVQNATTAGLRPDTGTPMLSGVLADFLDQLIHLDRQPYRRSRSRRDPGTLIEEGILGGSVDVQRSEIIDYPYFTYQPKGWKKSLPLMNASSMVSELAPVVLYLRYMVRTDSVLIIEEPESHLHPAMQVEFTRQIAALVHSGVRVIVTTHSEWVVETLANLMRLSELSRSKREDLKGADSMLRPQDVGVWLFKPRRSPKGSVVEERRFDADAGGVESGYSDVAEQLYNEWAAIGNRIEGNRR